MKKLNIDVEQGFKTEIEAVYLVTFSDGRYEANVGVKCGDTGIVLLCLSGCGSTHRAEWADNMLWTRFEEEFQIYIESHYTAPEFLRTLEKEHGFANNIECLYDYNISMAD